VLLEEILGDEVLLGGAVARFEVKVEDLLDHGGQMLLNGVQFLLGKLNALQALTVGNLQVGNLRHHLVMNYLLHRFHLPIS
jgi:hypothetical protein